MKYQWTNIVIIFCLLILVGGCSKKNSLEAANTLEAATNEVTTPKSNTSPPILPTTSPEPLTVYAPTVEVLETELESTAKNSTTTAATRAKVTGYKATPKSSSAAPQSSKSVQTTKTTETSKVQSTNTTTTQAAVSPTTTVASTAPESTVPPAKTSSFVSTLKVAETTDQLIIVIGQGDSKAKITYHQKSEDGIWTEIFSTSGVYGKNGASAEKKEGDGKTPIGCYTFTLSFGLKDDPDSILPYHKIVSGDCWVDDSDSPYYNQLVNTNIVKKDWSSAKNMSEQSPYYNYALAINYNPDNTSGKGSAIFLHCTSSSKDTGSQGCVRIPEEYAKQLVTSVDSKSKIIIVSEKDQLDNY